MTSEGDRWRDAQDSPGASVTWRSALAGYDPDTIIIVEIAEVFLRRHFGHDSESAERILSDFFEMKKKWIDEEYVRHQHSWRIATEAEYRTFLNGSPGELPEWRVSNGLVETPRDALEYLREHYWSRHS